MKLQAFVSAAMLTAAALFASGSASALPISGCTDNGDVTQTCNLYESDANASPSEVSSQATNIFGTDWNAGYVEIFDATPAVAPIISDIMVFTGGTATLYSFDDGGGAPADFPGFDSIGPNLGHATEDLTGFATFGEAFVTDCCDTINVFSPSDTVPEPITLSVFGAGLAGAAALRRRRKTGKVA